MGHRRGEGRRQAALFPVMLDELVSEDSLVRVVDAWVASLELKALGFGKAQAQVLGAPPYDPADLLKLYIWGYLSAVRSSRALERECRRNVECMWLLGRLAPDHKTIAEFRRTNTHALVAACAVFVQFARTQRLIAGNTVAIDGSKIRAVASRKAVMDQQALGEQARHNAQQIEQYLQMLDAQDRQDSAGDARAQDVRRALQRLQGQQAQVQKSLERLQQGRGQTAVRGEPQAQVMVQAGNRVPAYNLQTAVESQSHMIVAHDVTNEANDQRQLQPMAQAASRALGEPVIAVADAGYANGEQIANLGDEGITTFVAVKRAVNTQAGGTLYERSAFTYDTQSDSFACPVGKTLARKQLHSKDKLVIYAARPQDCGACANKAQCTTAAQRFVSRHLYEDALQANAQRMAERAEMMQLRKQTVEHPFADLKHLMLGNARLLMRGLDGARSELTIAVLAYNLKRAFNIKGAAWMRTALQG
ncbi:MAG: IS1182 family transposase [Polaromonas sp.]|uniref:IS1182 family transposase n=1 Tax=Polaromonas sp. TaxID=1869339 RepID=UPI002488C913|nr:IS1182 family transposase [Polaromonas sp.]MDI1240018.1 IS1182 family transposase [Polaromonas sp.]